MRVSRIAARECEPTAMRIVGYQLRYGDSGCTRRLDPPLRLLNLKMKKFRKLKVPLRFDPAASDYQKYVFEIAIFLVVVALIALNLPFTQVPVLVDGSYSAGETDFPIALEGLTKPVKTGWPMTFYRSHHFGTAATVTIWQFSGLLFDLLAAVAITALVGVFFWPRRARLRRKSRVKSKLVYALVAAGGIACVAAYLGLLATAGSTDEDTADQLREHGDVVRVAFVPQVIASVIPESWAKSRLRIALVDLKDADDRIVQLAVDQPELRSLRLSGSGYSTSSINNIDRLGFLQDVAIKSTILSVADMAGLSNCKLVSTLNLTGTQLGTNGAEPELALIAEIPRLAKLSLFESAIPYANIADSPLRKSLTHLILSRPDMESGTLNLNKWYQLRELQLLSRSDKPNPNKLELVVADLPLFNAIRIDPLQRLALSASNVPLLSKINAQSDVHFGAGDHHSNQSGQTPNGMEPTDGESVGVWFETLRLLEADNLTSLTIDGRDVRSISIDDCRSLQSVTILGNAANPLLASDASPAPIEQSTRQRIISALSDEVRKVPQIRLPGMKLDDLQLEPLTYNAGITRLDLTDAQLDLQSMTTLKEMRQLRELNLTGIPLEPQTFVWINETFPKLENLRVSHEFATRVLFENHSMLTGLTLDQYATPKIDALKLVNLKNFATPITVAENARVVNVQDLPSLTGLGVPVACKFTMREVDGLVWFASGGSNCNDDTVNELLNAKDLRSLTMVSPTANAETLAGIHELKSLEELNIAGAGVSDPFFFNWKFPDSLRSLIIDDCPISETGFNSLMLHQNWQSISLARTNVPATALGSLAKQSNLQVIGLAGLTIDSDALSALSNMSALTHLDLHGATLPDGAVNLIQKFVRLKQINLSDCGLTKTDIESIRANLPELEITSSDDSWAFSRSIASKPDTDPSSNGFAIPILRPSMFANQEQSLTSRR